MTLDELQKICDEATGGIWEYEDKSGYIMTHFGDSGHDICKFAPLLENQDAAFIVAARTYMPILVEIMRLYRDESEYRPRPYQIQEALGKLEDQIQEALDKLDSI